jgi:hypothetical protein
MRTRRQGLLAHAARYGFINPRAANDHVGASC